MSKIAALTAILATPAFAHQVKPETKFFQDAVAKNPEIQQVLAYCQLVGLASEEACQQEFFDAGNISETKIEAASKCLDASGLKYRAALDQYFKTDWQKVNEKAHQVSGSYWHEYYVSDPAEGKDAKPHRHFYTDYDLVDAGLKKGDEYVERYTKDQSFRDIVTKTENYGGEFRLSVEVAEGAKTREEGKTVTSAQVTEEGLKKARAMGDAFGKAHPDTVAGVQPHGVCYQGGNCGTSKGTFPNPDNAKREEVAKSTDPKPEKPKEEVKPPKEEETKDPFAPFTKESDTGGVTTEAPKEEKKAEEADKKEVKVKGTSTPVNNPKFYLEMNDCTQDVENQLLKQLGSKTIDPDAKTDEQKKAEAEELLKSGVCDAQYYGGKFCHDWKNANAQTEDENAEAKRKEAYDQAMVDFQNSGRCDELILGYEFCKPAKDKIDSTPINIVPWENDTMWNPTPPDTNPAPNDDWTPMGSDFLNPPSTAPSSDCERDMWGDCIVQ